MDDSLSTATATVLVDADLATYLADKCITAVPSAQRDLVLVRVELRNFHYRLGQIQENPIPKDLQPTFTNVIEACSSTCKRIGDILAGCGEDADPTRCWALVSAPTEIQQLRLELVQARRAMDMVNRALTLDYHTGLLKEIDDLRRVLTAGSSPLYASLVSFLDAIEVYISQVGISVDSSSTVSVSQLSPPIQDMMRSFRRSSLQDWETRDSAIYAMEDSDGLKIVDTNSPPHSPRNAVEGEIQPGHFVSKPDQTSFDSHDLRPPPLQIRPRNPKRESRSSPIYTLFPPASPPPARALPPVPPPKSPRRQNINSAASMSTRLADSSASVAAQAQARMYFTSTNPAELSSIGSIADRFSRSSKGSVVAPRPRSYESQPRPYSSLKPETVSDHHLTEIDIVPLGSLDNKEKEVSHGGVYSIDTSTDCTILASRHGKSHIRVWDIQTRTLSTTIKVPFYIQIQPRSRDYFVRSHAILSETLSLIAISAGFGQSIEIWNWSKRKKLQTISNATRWTAVRSGVYESCCCPLAAYSEDDNFIKLYPVVPKNKPLGKPRIIDLRKGGLPHLPKMPELAFSPTGPLLIAAAGPRPPRPGNPPPSHAALLMAWQLDGDKASHTPYKFLHTTNHPELENSLPLILETYGSVAVSIWEAAKFRTIGKPGMWQVEPITITERVVLVWDFSGLVDKTSTYFIPAVLACISPDCRFVAYCDPGGRNGGDAQGVLAVIDVTEGGRELWRLDASVPEADTTAADLARKSNRWSRKSSDTRRSGHRSDQSSDIVRVEGLELLAQNLKKVTELAFSSDGTRLLVGDETGDIGIYEFRVEGLHGTLSVESG